MKNHEKQRRKTCNPSLGNQSLRDYLPKDNGRANVKGNFNFNFNFNGKGKGKTRNPSLGRTSLCDVLPRDNGRALGIFSQKPRKNAGANGRAKVKNKGNFKVRVNVKFKFKILGLRPSPCREA